ncbi:MAG: M20/M25/M40 family metallo-hydrolase [Candidatus Zixiibacteriota bacterium]
MRKLFLAAVFILLFSVSAHADNLYLLSITDNVILDIVKDNIDHAHGAIGGKFIVFIDEKQNTILNNAGVEMQFLAGDCLPEDYCLIREEFDRTGKSAVSIPSIYEIPGGQIARLEENSYSILEREGYLMTPLAEKNTPFFYNPPSIAMPMSEDFPTDTLAALINTDSLFSYVQQLENFYTRFTPSDSCKRARDWIINKLTSFGYTDIQTQFFLATREFQGVINEPAYNVICTKTGYEKPDNWLIISGHYDSYSGSEVYGAAPGADDNAAGAAAMLELARIFRNVDFRKSIMFVAFGAEEQGRVGSEFMAQGIYEDAVDLELVINFDVIAYESDTIPSISLSATPDYLYANLFVEAAERLTDLMIWSMSTYPVSDNTSFYDYGYYTIMPWESHLTPYYHSAFDLSSTINPGFMTKIVKMSTAAISVIDKSADPVICDLYDIGDGHSLRVVWDSCFANYSYDVLYGTSEGVPTDTLDIPDGQCTIDITGLTEGLNYYVSVVPYPEGGYPPLYLEISSEKPLSTPRQPTGVDAEPVQGGILISWNENPELDINHYKLFRTYRGSNWILYEENLTGTEHIDSGVVSGQEYTYYISAIDNDDNESVNSPTVSSIPAFFDMGVLIADETQTGGDNPTELIQRIYFQYMMGDIPFDVIMIDSAYDAISRARAGQYNPIIWIDDDDCNHVLSGSLDTLEWYFRFDTDFMLSGWKTIYTITGQNYFYSGDYFYDNFGISYIAQNSLYDFTGATGGSGWPDLQIRPDAPGAGRMPFIDIFSAAPNAEIILTFNSASSNHFYNGKPVGVAYDTHHGKRIVLGFPVYYLTDESIQALMARVFEYFAEESVLYGDVNGDWGINILDVTYLINYLYKGGPAPTDMNNGDPNGSCAVNILDVTYLISYLYKGGPEPLEGCVI